VGECSFWYRPTRVVPDQRPLNGRCCYLLAVSKLITLNPSLKEGDSADVRDCSFRGQVSGGQMSGDACTQSTDGGGSATEAR